MSRSWIAAVAAVFFLAAPAAGTRTSPGRGTDTGVPAEPAAERPEQHAEG